MEIRKATPEDKDNILRLINNVFEKQQHYAWVRNEAYWQWKYESNVFGKPIVHIASQEGEVIGSSTLWPWKYTYRGQILPAFQPCDTVVNPNYQGKGVFSKINKFRITELLEEKVLFVFNFPNKNSVKGYLSFGWHYLAHIPWVIRPISPLGVLRNKMGKSQATSVSLESPHLPNWNDCYAICDSKDQYKGVLNTYREKGFFEWRYQNHPFFKYGLVIVQQGRKKAAAVFSINQKGNSREMLVVDIFGSDALCNVLGKKLIKTAKSYQADFVAMIYNPNFNMQSLWKLGFMKMRNKNMVVLPLNFALECKVSNYANWSLIGAMHDSI